MISDHGSSLNHLTLRVHSSSLSSGLQILSVPHVLIIHHSILATLTRRSLSIHVARLRASILEIVEVAVHLEGRLQQHRQQVDDVLRATETCDLSLVLAILLLLLSSLVVDLLIANGPHLLGVAILSVQRILSFEQHVSRVFFGNFALVLLLEVDEGLLGSRDHFDTVYFTLASSGEVESKLVRSSTSWEVLYKETEKHYRLLVLEVVQ